MLDFVIRVKFLGTLVRFTHQLVEKNVQLLETGPVHEDSWIDALANKSILDLIGFPAAGIAHFHSMRDTNVDPAHQQKMDQEDLLVEERIIRRRQGQATGREMDDDILGISVPQPQRRGEEAARPVVLKGQLWLIGC
jgi:hypothetical protein